MADQNKNSYFLALQEQSYFVPYHYFYNKKNLGEILHESFYDIAIDLVKEILPLGKSSLILDAGCGDGKFIFEFNKKSRMPLAEIYGADCSFAAITFAKIYNPEAKFFVNNLEQTEFSDDYFDIIVCIETLEHVIPHEIPKIIKEFSRILKKDGKLIITVPSKNEKLSKGHFQHFSYEDLKLLLEPFFEVKKSLGNDKRNFWLNFFYLLMENRFYLIKHKRMRNLMEKVYNKYGKICSIESGNRIIVACAVLPQ